MTWTPPKKFAELAENPLIRDWLRSYPAYNTKKEHLRRFGRLLTAIQYTPEQILAEAENGNGKALKSKVKDYCMGFVDQGKTATASLTLSSFRSFLLSKEIQLTWTRQDMIEVVAVRTDRKVPTKEQVFRILDGLNAESHLGLERIARYKAMIWTAYQTGVRPGCLLKLRVGDVDLSKEPPIPIKITPQLDSKIRRPLAKIGYYWTFVGPEAQKTIEEYLRMRERSGQKLGPESPLFESFHNRGGHIDIGAWGDIVRRLGKFAGFKPGEISPHSFRHAFRKQIRYHVDDQVGTVLAGHKIRGSEESYFDRKDMDFLRNEYAKVDWKREKTVTVTEVHKLQEEIEQLRTKEKELEDLIRKVAEEERKPVTREQ